MSVRTLAQLKKEFGDWNKKSPGKFENLIDTLNGKGSGFMTTAEILDGNTTPKVLEAAQGTTHFINVKKAWAAIPYNSAAYATNVSLDLRLGTTVIGTCAVLDVTADTIKEFTLADGVVIPSNANLNVIVKTSDPITGDSPAGIFYDYSIDPDMVALVPVA